MSEKKWTEAQQQVIDSRKENLLVSAAAGSGKTAVLVEHIISQISDKTNPMDIDEIIVVTFTKAAAAEMRERILEAIEKALEEDPLNEHFMRQTTLIHNALITTIDSFCGYVVRNHFHEIDLEPDYRIGDEGELKLMHEAVMDQFMEEQYLRAKEIEASGQESEFINFVDTYALGNADVVITDMISKLYHKAQSYPWPKEWLHDLRNTYQIQSVLELCQKAWFDQWMKRVRTLVEEAAKQIQGTIDICHREHGPEFYLPTMEADLMAIEDALAFDDNQRFFEAMRHISWVKLARKPASFDDVDDLIDVVKQRREETKKFVSKLQNDYFKWSLEEVVMQIQAQKDMAFTLLDLTEGFMDAFAAYKKKKNVMDFNDIEHFALEILQDEKTHLTKPAAFEFQNHFKEIIIDEYQDSNYIQEAILTSISRESLGEHNMFMVGDVKQSIYSFRQACPEIFVEKYQRFQEKKEGNRAIDLQKNFRSRQEVLDVSNHIFYRLMKEDLGDVSYTEDVALNFGATYYEKNETMFAPEIMIGHNDKGLFADAGIEDKIDFEVKMIIDKIRAMQKEGQLVTDKETGKLRPMRYKDIVILMRSPNKYAADMISILEENGIPAFAESKTGYFDSIEVETVMNLLRVLDNPYQDIPLLSLLHSPIFGLSLDDLSSYKRGKKSLAENIMQQGREDEKLAYFFALFDQMRSKIAELTIHEYLEYVLDVTGYYDYVCALPRGESRQLNLDKLMDQANVYASTSFKGLFHFVNYIEKCQKYEIDMGEAEQISENDDAIAIISIHKSKGLEYPICFIAGMGRQFNKQDLNDKLVVDQEVGLGLSLIDRQKQTKENGFLRSLIRKNLEWQLLGEEMRILYVALTRAKEKLILVGCVSKLEETLPKWESTRGELSLHERESAGCYLEWVVRATADARDVYPIVQVSPEDVVFEEILATHEKAKRKEALLSLAQMSSAKEVKELSDRLAYQYPYERRDHVKTKYSVSEIKHKSMEKIFADENSAKPQFLKEDREAKVPVFLSKKEKNPVPQGALRGTAMHRYLECFDFTRIAEADIAYVQLQEMRKSGRLDEDDAKLISMERIQDFLKTDLAHRMAAAAREGNLFVEKPFVMAWDQKENQDVLVQGIIDVFFVEDEHIVLLDYKTDKVHQEEELIKRYDTQLKLYGQAISQSLHLPVEEMLIYSFSLEKVVAL